MLRLVHVVHEERVGHWARDEGAHNDVEARREQSVRVRRRIALRGVVVVRLRCSRRGARRGRRRDELFEEGKPQVSRRPLAKRDAKKPHAPLRQAPHQRLLVVRREQCQAHEEVDDHLYRRRREDKVVALGLRCVRRLRHRRHRRAAFRLEPLGGRRAVGLCAVGGLLRVVYPAHLPGDDEVREAHSQLPVLHRAVGRQPQAVQRVDHLRHELRPVRVEQVRVAHDELPHVDELRQRVALLVHDLLGPFYGLYKVRRGQPLRERGHEDVQRDLDELARLRLEGAEEGDVDLQDDLRRRLVRGYEAADVDIGPLLR
mmetsp:Transcript_24099/g.81247  ORF Transcript_24099/g.81247 Transcript_24099/m.81247 type:complete len:315 (+) Transcript_24099:1440-2384(+)